MVKLDLVHSRNDPEYAELISGYSTLPPPSGLEILASYVQKNMPSATIMVHDGWHQEDVSLQIEGDFVGISDWFTSHKNAMQIARKAKERNPSCKTIIGGPNASNLGDRILLNHPYVDYVVVGDGEEALLKILEGTSSTEIPNLWYRDGKLAKFTFLRNVPLNSLPLFDFDHTQLSSLQEYDARRQDYREDIDRTPIPVSSIRGCIKATKIGKCSYCNIPLQSIRVASPEQFWKQIEKLHRKYGVTSFFETGDDFIVGTYPEQLLKTKPSNLEARFRIYASPDKIDGKIAEVLKKIGVREIFLGIENINPEVLARANKFYNVTKVEDSVRNCQEHGIGVFLPFLFGLPGETEETARKNDGFARNIIEKYNNVHRVLYSLAVPIVGCSWFTELSGDSEVRRQYPEITTTDSLDYAYLTKLSIQTLCSVELDTLLKILDYPPSAGKKERTASYGDMAHKIRRKQ